MFKIKKRSFIKKQSRLKFTEEERADPILEKSITKSKKAAQSTQTTVKTTKPAFKMRQARYQR